MPLSKVYKFTAATVMATVAAATVVTFAQADQPGTSAASALVPRVPGNEPAPIVGTNDNAPTPLPSPVTDGSELQAGPPPAAEATTPSRSSARAPKTAVKPKPTKSTPSPSPSPTQKRPLKDLLSHLLG